MASLISLIPRTPAGRRFYSGCLQKRIRRFYRCICRSGSRLWFTIILLLLALGYFLTKYEEIWHGRFKPGRQHRTQMRTVSTGLKDQCQELIQGARPGKVRRAVRYQPSQEELWRHIHAANGTCEDFLRSGDYLQTPLNPHEEAFPLAYSLVTYKSPHQVERLLHAIYRPQNVYCIHVDAKSPPSMFSVLQRVAHCLPNVFIPAVRHSVAWGRFSVIQPEMTCMRELLRHKRWKYFINLTGQEFPLKTNWEIVQILREFKGANDIIGSVKLKNKNRTLYVFKDGIRGTVKKDPPPHGIVITKGAVHMIACRGYVDYVINSPVAQDFLTWVQNTKVPDETFFTSLNHNPQLGIPGSFTGTVEEDETGEKDSVLRFKRWSPDMRSRHRCPGKYQFVLHNICLVGVELLPDVTQSRALFVNKLDIDVQPIALECLHDWIWGRVLKEYQNPHSSHIDVSYYRNLDFVQKHVMPDESEDV